MKTVVQLRVEKGYGDNQWFRDNDQNIAQFQFKFLGLMLKSLLIKLDQVYTNQDPWCDWDCYAELPSIFNVLVISHCAGQSLQYVGHFAVGWDVLNWSQVEHNAIDYNEKRENRHQTAHPAPSCVAQFPVIAGQDHYLSSTLLGKLYLKKTQFKWQTAIYTKFNVSVSSELRVLLSKLYKETRNNWQNVDQ